MCLLLRPSEVERLTGQQTGCLLILSAMRHRRQERPTAPADSCRLTWTGGLATSQTPLASRLETHRGPRADIAPLAGAVWLQLSLGPVEGGGYWTAGLRLSPRGGVTRAGRL